MQQLEELIDFSTYTKEQAVDLARVFYLLLQERKIEMQLTTAPAPYVFNTTSI